MARRTPPEKVEEMLALRREQPDLATPEIAEIVGVSPQAVLKWLKRNGLDYGWRRPVIPRETERKIVERYVKHRWSADRVAAEVHVGRGTVIRTLERYGVPTRPKGTTGPRLPAQELEPIRRLYEEEELSHREIAERLGVHESTVKSRLHSAGVQRRTRSEAITIGQRRAYARLTPEEFARRTGKKTQRKGEGDGRRPDG